MPGFNIGGYGGQQDGIADPASLVEIRRTHRWVFETLGFLTNPAVTLILKTAQRPSFQFEEPVMHHNQERIYFAGQQTWEPISLSFYDEEQPADCSDAIYKWLGSVTDLETVCVASPVVYKSKQSHLCMLDGCGNACESWILYNGWPKETNWKELDYSSTELQLIEVKFRFDRALKQPSTGI